jgi:hypothetical protein
MSPSFAVDIAPMLAPYRENMLWRFDLADYTAVTANAQIIYEALTGKGSIRPMPPPPLPALSGAQVAKFKSWMEHQCPP